MAPLAVSPRVLRELPAGQRRRWVIAAAATGAMLTSQAVGDSEVVADLPVAPPGAVDTHELDALLVGATDDTAAWAAPTRAGATDDPPAWATSAPAPSLVTTGGRSTSMVALAPGAASTAPSEGTVNDDGHGDGALPDGPVEVARFEDITVVTDGAGIELVGFHESSDPDAIVLEPSGSVEIPAPDGSTDVGPAIVLPTRHRAGAPTSAVDLAMAPGHEVPAPISGEIIEVADFSLYGSTPDLIVRIRSEADPSVVATVMHLDRGRVAVGDLVEAGITPIAAEALQLPFESQIDRFTTVHRGAPAPHVHIELGFA